MKLSILDIINNAKDELDRTREIILSNEETKEMAEMSMLISDIDSSLERLEEVKERIEFALILAVYAGNNNAELNFKHDCDNAEWREKYLQIASDIDLEYEGNYVNSEWAYNTASDLAKKLFN